MSTPFPTSLATKIKRLVITLDENVAQSESIFTRQRQTVSLAGGTSDRWQGMIETVYLLPADVKAMAAFLRKVGRFGEFTFGHFDYTGPQSGATTGSVQGAGQSGTSLVVDGVTPSSTVLHDGEYFQVRNQFCQVYGDCVANGSGVVTLGPFKPALRVSPADNDPVIFNAPKILAQLLDVPPEDTDDLGMGSFAIPFQESMTLS